MTHLDETKFLNH